MSRSGIEGPSQGGPLPHLASKAVGERREEFRAHIWPIQSRVFPVETVLNTRD